MFCIKFGWPRSSKGRWAERLCEPACLSLAAGLLQSGWSSKAEWPGCTGLGRWALALLQEGTRREVGTYEQWMKQVLLFLPSQWGPREMLLVV